MIIDEKILVKNSNYYKKLGYISDEKYITIDINDLTKNSHIKVNAKCAYCETEKSIIYSAYNKNISTGPYACSKCSYLKIKENNLKKYGVENTFQLKESKEKSKKTNLEKRGTEFASQSIEFKEKVKQTNLEKYGVEYTFQSDESKLKIKQTNLEKYGFENPFESKLIQEKIRQTNLNKYGVEHALQSDEIKEKVKQTNLERYSVENTFQFEVFKEKIKQTNLERYGVEHPMLLDSLKEKIKQTNLENYGVEFALQSDIVKERAKQTNLDRYGVHHPMLLDSIKEKLKSTNLEKYGFEHALQCDDFKEKLRQTNINKYGTEFPTRSELIRKKNFEIANHPDYIKYVDKKISLFKCHKGHNFEINSDNFSSRNNNNISICTICNPISESNSIKQKELYEFVNMNYNGNIIDSHKDKYEIDVYLPELKLGFEFNGIYWHSDIYKDKNYHINKTNYFKDKDIRIIHIWEDDWTFKQDIVKSQVKNLLGFSDRIWARKCQIKEVDTKEAKLFLNNNHIQGFVNSNIKIGLYYNQELVSIMTFDKFEGRKKLTDLEWNLNRFCNKIGYSIIGGASKLLKYFINKYSPNRIISYADKDWSIGNLYEKLGFIIINESVPDYKYLVDKKRIHKSRFKKSKTGISESNLNIPKIWDCGKIKFELKTKPTD